MSQTLNTQIRVTRSVDGTNTNMGVVASSSVTSSDNLAMQNIQVVGTAAEALVANDVTDEARMVIRNLDATNFIEVGSGSFTAWFKVPPGEIADLPRVTSLAAVQLRANTANCQVEITLYKIAP